MKKFALLAALLLAGLAAKEHFASRGLPAGPALPEGDLIRTVSNGEAIELVDLLDEGEWTIALFTAPWCSGCRQLEPRLEAAIRERGDVRLRKINIGNWSSPVARRYGIESIPQLWLHDGTERIATDTHDVLRRLEE